MIFPVIGGIFAAGAAMYGAFKGYAWWRGANSAREDMLPLEAPGWDATGVLYATLGWPYYFGRGTPATTVEEAEEDGVDCSGYVQVAQAQVLHILNPAYPDRGARGLADDCDEIPVGEQLPGDIAIYDGHVMLVCGYPIASEGGHSAVIGASGGTSTTKGDDPNACVKMFSTALYRDDFICYGRLKAGKR